MVITWMSHYETLARVAYEFRTSTTAACRDVHHILPIIIEQYADLIQWPDEEERTVLEGMIPYFRGAMGFTDGSHSSILKPWAEDAETEFWCTHGDERTHTMALQVTTNYHGIPIHVSFGHPGASNDIRIYYRSGLGDMELSEGQYILTDAEYHGLDRFVCPYHANGM